MGQPSTLILINAAGTRTRKPVHMNIKVILALFLAGAAFWIYLSFQRDLTAARERLTGQSKIVETKSGPIEYAEAGEGPVILVIHGAGGGFDQGLEILAPLARRGFRLVAVSRFGYLRTPFPADASPAAQADAHAHLLDALGIQRAAIFGVSAGGPSAMQFAIRHPARATALILMVPMAYKPADSAPKISPLTEKILLNIVGSDFAFWIISTIAPSLIVKTVMATPPEVLAAASEDERMRVNQFMRHILPVSHRIQGIIQDSKIANSLSRYALENIKVPTLIMSARDDLYGTYASSEYTAQEIAGAKFVGFETGGHMLVGHWEAVATEMENLLTGQ